MTFSKNKVVINITFRIELFTLDRLRQGFGIAEDQMSRYKL